MADSSVPQRSLHSRSKGPSGPALPPSGNSGLSGQGERTRSNAAALNRLLSPLPIGASSASNQRSLPSAPNRATPSQPLPTQSRQGVRSISSWRPTTVPRGHPSTSDAAQAEPDGEEPSGDAARIPRSATRSATRSIEYEDDPQREPTFPAGGSPSDSGDPDRGDSDQGDPDQGDPDPATSPPRAPTSVPYRRGKCLLDRPVNVGLPDHVPL